MNWRILTALAVVSAVVLLAFGCRGKGKHAPIAKKDKPVATEQTPQAAAATEQYRIASEINNDSSFSWAGLVSEQSIYPFKEDGEIDYDEPAPPETMTKFERYLQYDQMELFKDLYFSAALMDFAYSSLGGKTSVGQGGTSAPHALLIADVYRTEMPVQTYVRLNAGLSQGDESGPPTAYLWDYLNPIGQPPIFFPGRSQPNGEFDGGPTTSPFIDVLIEPQFAVGKLEFVVRVFDDDGGYDTTGVVVDFNGGWPNIFSSSFAWNEQEQAPYCAFCWWDLYPIVGLEGSTPPAVILAKPNIQAEKTGAYQLLVAENKSLVNNLFSEPGAPVRIDLRGSLNIPYAAYTRIRGTVNPTGDGSWEPAIRYADVNGEFHEEAIYRWSGDYVVARLPVVPFPTDSDLVFWQYPPYFGFTDSFGAFAFPARYMYPKTENPLGEDDWEYRRGLYAFERSASGNWYEFYRPLVTCLPEEVAISEIDSFDIDLASSGNLVGVASVRNTFPNGDEREEARVFWWTRNPGSGYARPKWIENTWINDQSYRNLLEEEGTEPDTQLGCWADGEMIDNIAYYISYASYGKRNNSDGKYRIYAVRLPLYTTSSQFGNAFKELVYEVSGSESGPVIMTQITCPDFANGPMVSFWEYIPSEDAWHLMVYMRSDNADWGHGGIDDQNKWVGWGNNDDELGLTPFTGIFIDAQQVAPNGLKIPNSELFHAIPVSSQILSHEFNARLSGLSGEVMIAYTSGLNGIQGAGGLPQLSLSAARIATKAAVSNWQQD
ncbi:MAG: hypothetical protein HRF49_12260 [bacterium]|jgi:hypothetical protein